MNAMEQGVQAQTGAVPFASLLRCAGYSLMFLANHLILRDPVAVIASLGMLGHESLLVRMSLDVAFIAGLLAIGIYTLVKRRNLSVRTMLAGQGILVVAFIFAMLVCLDPRTLLSPEALLVTLLGALGFFAALGLEVWVLFLSKVPAGTAWFDIVFGLLVSSFAYGFLVFVSEVVPSCLVLTVVCLASLGCSVGYYRLQLRTAGPDIEEGGNGAGAAEEVAVPLGKGRLSRLRRALADNAAVILCAMALGFALSASSMISVHEAGSGPITLMFTLGILFAALFFLGCIYAGRSPVSIRLIYQVAFPLLAFFFLLLPYMGNAFRYAFLLIAATVGTMGATSLFFAAFDSERLYHVPSMGLLGLFLGCSHIFYLAGWAGNLEDSLGFMWYAASTLLLIYVFVAVVLLGRRKKAERTDGSAVVFIGSEQQLQSACEDIARQFSLSPRESDVLGLLVRGATAEDIAEKLVISVSTVRTHTKNIYKKVGVHTRSELFGLASQREGMS